MKFASAAIVSLVLTSAVMVACASTPVGSDYALEIKTGGGITGPFFTVVLTSNGRLSVMKEGLPFAETKSHLTTDTKSVQLPPKDTEKLFSLARSVDDFSEGCDVVGHGTSAHMRLTDKANAAEFSCNNAQKWPIGAHTRELIAALNLHLPQKLQVF